MSSTAPIPPITGTVTLAVPVERAFAVFTGSVNAWWPHQYHIGQAEVAEVVLEPGVGGRWFERGVDGSECDWGRVRVWEPPTRLVFTWQINGSWQFDPDPERASEIEARFTASGPEQSLSRSSTATSNASRAGRRSATRSPVAAAGRCCSTVSPRPWPSRADRHGRHEHGRDGHGPR
jgi:uncharacterized protein YndB with AHSA1/START domain